MKSSALKGEGFVARCLRATEGFRRRHLDARREPTSGELRELLEAACDAVIALDPDGRVSCVLTRQANLLERTPDELLGLDANALVHPADAEATSRLLDSLTRSPRTARARVATAAGEWQEIEAQLIRIAGSDRLWALCRRSRGPDLVGSIGVRASQLDGLAWCARRIVHRMNNLRHVVRARIEAESPTTGPAGPESSWLREIEQSADRAVALAGQLLSLAESRSSDTAAVDVVRELERRRGTLESAVGEPAELMSDAVGEPLLARVDPGVLELALVSLLVSLSQQLGATARLRIRTAACDEGLAIEVSAWEPGAGVPTGESRFDPLAQRPDAYARRGSGLAFVVGVLKPYGGRLDVGATTGSARSYRIVLPRVGAAAAPSPSDASRAAHAPGSGATVLVIDDSSELRQLAARILVDHGYRVLEASSGATAAEVARAYGGRIDLLLADLILADESGLEARNRVAEIQPEVRSLFMSGFPDVLGFPTSLEEDAPAILSKPFCGDQLVDAVREALAER